MLNLIFPKYKIVKNIYFMMFYILLFMDNLIMKCLINKVLK